MRTRIRDDRKDVTITEYRDGTYLNECNGQETQHTLENQGSYERTVDVVTKRFSERRARGEVIMNPFRQYKEDRSVESAGWSATRATENYSCYEWSGDGPLWACLYPEIQSLWHLPGGVNLGNLRRLAATSALADVKKPEHASLVSLGELRETVQYLRNPISSLTTYIRRNRNVIKRDLQREKVYLNRLTKSMRRGTRSERANQYARKVLRSNSLKQSFNSNEVRAISDAYLGGRYGLRPLVGEVQSIMSAINADMAKSPPRETARGYESDEQTLSRDGPSWSHLHWTATSQEETVDSVECSAGVLYSVDIRDTWGTDFSQVPVALWETTFLSFMADWFANMGDFLAAVTPKSGIRVHGSWVTTRRTKSTVRDHDCTFTKASNSEYSENIDPSGSEYVTSHYVDRKPSINAGLAYRPSGVRFDLGTARIVDMFAIARNLLF